MTDSLSRRAFAERLALTLAAPWVLDDVAGAAPGVTAEQQAQEPSALAKALAEGIRTRYGDRLTADDLTTITRSIDSRLRNLERLYTLPLANSDEPDFIFSVYRGADG